MKFQFKIQQYQTDAVNSVVNIFAGQPYSDRVSYVRDLGINKKNQYTQISLFNEPGSPDDDVDKAQGVVKVEVGERKNKNI